MVFDHIEQLKRQYTDKYVVVDESRPELARFRGVTGIVKTVNMSGRALVEFDSYHANIGWYDIELDFLHVVPKPEPGEAPAHGAKPAAKAAPAVPAAKPAAKAAPAKPAAVKPAAAKPAPAKAAGKGSTADVLAALRAGKPAGAPVKAPAPAPSDASEMEETELGDPDTTPEPESTIEGDSAEVAAPAKKPARAGGAIDAGKLGSKTLKNPADQIAYCRQADTKS